MSLVPVLLLALLPAVATAAVAFYLWCAFDTEERERDSNCVSARLQQPLLLMQHPRLR